MKAELKNALAADEEIPQEVNSADPSDTSTLDQSLNSEDADISAVDLEEAFGPPTPTHCDPSSHSFPITPLDVHNSEISVEIKLLNDFSSGKFVRGHTEAGEAITVRMAKRMKYIEQTVRSCRIIEDFSKLLSGLQRQELLMGYTDQVCRRTIHRLLAKMSEDRKLRMFGVYFRSKEQNSSQVLLICHPNVEQTDDMLVSVVEKEKLKFLIRLHNEQIRLKRKLGEVNDDEGCRAKKKSTEKKVKLAENVVSTHQPLLVSDIRNAITPKFHKIRVMHELWFYLAYDHPSNPQIIQPSEAMDMWKIVEPRIDYEQLHSELPTIYSIEIGWKMFVPPIPRYSPFIENGWLLLDDALLRMPLSIYVSISNITSEVTGLDEILAHPIRKHFPLCNLPPTLQAQLMGQRKHIISTLECCRMAACLGLIQFGPERLKDKAQVHLYINQYASQRNTVASEPGCYKVSAQDYPRKMYIFNTVEDLAAYWSDLHTICVNTSLGKRMITDYNVLRWDMQPQMIAAWQNRTREFVLSNDLGEQPGDGCGAGGVDSSMFAHLNRNWSIQRAILKRTKKPKATLTFPPFTFGGVLNRKVDEVPSSAVAIAPDRTSVASIPRANRNKRHIPRRVTVAVRKKRDKRQHYDDVDRQALRKMVKLRVDWNQEEDNLLLLCRAAMLTMIPALNRKVVISSQQIRDILYWSLKSLDKTSRSCQRRIVYMLRKEQLASKVHMLVQEIEQNRSIKKHFGESFYQTLLEQFPDETDCLHALRTHYVDFVYQLKTKFLSDTSVDAKNATQLPNTLAEFHQTFATNFKSYSHNHLKYSSPKQPQDIEVTVITSIIHSSCCCVRDKTSWNIQLYEIYRAYPDQSLSAAMLKLRDDQLISANNKLRKNALPLRNLPLSCYPYHLSVTYQYAMLTTIPVRLIDDAYKTYSEISAASATTNEAGMPLHRIDGGCFMFIAEQLYHNPSTPIDIAIPNPVLVFDTSKYPTVNKELLQRINTRFRGIFEYVMNDNNQKLRDANNVAITNSKPAITDDVGVIHMNTGRVTVLPRERPVFGLSPIEKLVELDECMFHFYCVLNAIGGFATVAKLTIDEDKRCPFDCVLAKENPLDILEGIIRRHGDSLPRIKEEHQLDLTMMNEFQISVWNVLTVFNVLVSKRLKVGEDEGETMEDDDVEAEEVNDYGMPALSLEILRALQETNALNVDEVDEPAVVVVEPEKEYPKLDTIIREESDVNYGDKIYISVQDYFFLNPCRLSLRLASNQDLVQSDQTMRDAFLENITR